MKKINLKLSGAIFLFMLISGTISAQWRSAELNVNFALPEIALIDIEPGINNDVHFTVNPAVEPGSAPVVSESKGTKLWINYSSSLSSTRNSRSIVAEISQGTVPSGVTISLTASGASGTGKGQRGQSTGKVQLSGQPKPIISNIGNCFTGNGVNNGHLLTFSIEIQDYSKVFAAQNSNFLVVYTITDN